MIINHLRGDFAERRTHQDGRGAEGAEAETKNVGVEETDPRRPHFCVTGENSKSGAGSGFAYDEQD